MIILHNTQHFYYNIIVSICHTYLEGEMEKEREKLPVKKQKKTQKNLQKSVDIQKSLWYYIQVDAIRQQNKAKVARQ